MSGSSVEKQSKLDVELVRKLLDYCPVCGLFFWKVKRGPARIGSVAGHSGTQGYWIIKIDGLNFLAHRIAWAIQTGKWPKGEIDHTDLNRGNNKWTNLREATHGQNQSNSKVYKNNRIGLKGVSTIPTRPGKFRARIRKDGVEISLGVWPTAEEAHLAYINAARELHGVYWRVE
jgi:hypothetical protein